MEAVHWAVLELKRRPAALDLPEGMMDESTRATAMVWHLRALMPDGRVVRVLAWAPQPKQVAITVRVGRFGAVAEQQRFVDALGLVLEGPPKRVRHDKFVLPRVDEAEGTKQTDGGIPVE